MPLIASRTGGFVLVCINGCVPPDMTKGVRAMVRRADYDYDYPQSEPGSPDEPTIGPDGVPLATQAWKEGRLAAEPTTMRRVPGWFSWFGHGAAPGTFNEPKMIRSSPKPWVPDSDPVPPGVRVRLFVCQVCGYTESYAGTRPSGGT